MYSAAREAGVAVELCTGKATAVMTQGCPSPKHSIDAPGRPGRAPGSDQGKPSTGVLAVPRPHMARRSATAYPLMYPHPIRWSQRSLPGSSRRCAPPQETPSQTARPVEGHVRTSVTAATQNAKSQTHGSSEGGGGCTIWCRRDQSPRRAAPHPPPPTGSGGGVGRHNSVCGPVEVSWRSLRPETPLPLGGWDPAGGTRPELRGGAAATRGAPRPPHTPTSPPPPRQHVRWGHLRHRRRSVTIAAGDVLGPPTELHPLTASSPFVCPPPHHSLQTSKATASPTVRAW